MKVRRQLTCAVLAIAIAAGGAVVVQTQAAGSAGNVDLSGRWTLDTYLSDNAEQVAAALRIDLGLGSGQQRSIPIEGGRYGRGRGRSDLPPAGRPTEVSAAEQNRLEEMVAPLRYPPATLTISQTADAVTFGGAQGESRRFAPNNSRDKQTVGGNSIETRTRWEGPQLVSEHDIGSGRKITYTYSIVPTTKQLLVRISIERGLGDVGPFEIKQVYNKEAAR